MVDLNHSLHSRDNQPKNMDLECVHRTHTQVYKCFLYPTLAAAGYSTYTDYLHALITNLKVFPDTNLRL